MLRLIPSLAPHGSGTPTGKLLVIKSLGIQVVVHEPTLSGERPASMLHVCCQLANGALEDYSDWRVSLVSLLAFLSEPCFQMFTCGCRVRSALYGFTSPRADFYTLAY